MKPIYNQILDSRGNPTIQAQYKELIVAVPSGASTGAHEAPELRDHQEEYEGNTVYKAIQNAQHLSEELDWETITIADADKKILDTDKTKKLLGANATLAVSLLAGSIQANREGKQPYELIAELSGNKPLLPMPFANVINGGKHADNDLMIQEIMIVPTNAHTFAEATRQVTETYHALKTILKKRYGGASTALGDEGGFAPPITHIEEALSILIEAMSNAGHKLSFAIDAAASEFYSDKGYEIRPGEYMTAEELIEYYVHLIDTYPIISLEDPFDEEDYASFAKLRKKVRIQIVGDDLTVTNTQRIQEAINQESCNSLLLKVNQIGTLTEALEAAKLSKDNGWTVMVSHRSGETSDTWIADIATGLGCGEIKLGAPARGERVAKYNRLLTIEAVHNLAFAQWKNI